MKYVKSRVVLVNLDKFFCEQTTLYVPGRILIFSTLKLNENTASVSPTTIEKSFDSGFFLSLTRIFTTPSPQLQQDQVIDRSLLL